MTGQPGQPTRPQLEMLVLRSRGMTFEEIGRLRSFAPQTVKYHLDALRAILGARDLHNAIAIAVSAGLILPDGRAHELFVPDEIPEYVPKSEVAGAGDPA